MRQKFTPNELYELRNFISINDLIRDLEIPFKISEGYVRFLCPLCKEFQTATKEETNLARCFRCERNFNTIDFVMILRQLPFVDSVRFLQKHYVKIQTNMSRAADLKEKIKHMTKAL